MPIFEYQCQQCSESFEKITLASSQTKPDCPECGSEDVAKQISTFAAKSNDPGPGSFSETNAPSCGSCGVPGGPCAVN